MFFSLKAPLEGTCTALQALRLSLNSPVVTIESLPVGPASAAIALHLGTPERPRVSIAIRSAQTRQLAFYSADEERAEFRTAGVAIDAALSFAESMGFLFDDDEVEAQGAAGPQQAGRLWSEFVSSADPEPEAPELLLEEVAEPEPESPLERLVSPAAQETWLEEEVSVIAEAPSPPPSPAPEPPSPQPPVTARPRDPVSPPAAAAEPARASVAAAPGAGACDAPTLMMTKFRRAAASVADEAAPDGRIRLLSNF